MFTRCTATSLHDFRLFFCFQRDSTTTMGYRALRFYRAITSISSFPTSYNQIQAAWSDESGLAITQHSKAKSSACVHMLFLQVVVPSIPVHDGTFRVLQTPSNRHTSESTTDQNPHAIHTCAPACIAHSCMHSMPLRFLSPRLLLLISFVGVTVPVCPLKLDPRWHACPVPFESLRIKRRTKIPMASRWLPELRAPGTDLLSIGWINPI
jgi:hypothetical protein